MRNLTIAAICLLAIAGLVWAQDAPVKVTEEAAKQAAVTKVVPDYPAIARQMKLAGRVEVSAVIGVDGSVEKAEIVSGNPLLSGAATTALKKWKFTPFTADGKPYRAQTTITFEFKM